MERWRAADGRAKRALFNEVEGSTTKGCPHTSLCLSILSLFLKVPRSLSTIFSSVFSFLSLRWISPPIAAPHDSRTEEFRSRLIISFSSRCCACSTFSFLYSPQSKACVFYVYTKTNPVVSIVCPLWCLYVDVGKHLPRGSLPAFKTVFC